MLLVDQAPYLEAVEQRHHVARVAIEVRVVLVAVAVDDEGIPGDAPAEAELVVALRQHRALVEAARLQDAADLGHRRADDVRVAVIDDVVGQHVVEMRVGIGQPRHHAD